jgi:hypothetical protein
MPSAATTPAFIHYGDWDDITRAHPAMRWMESFTRAWDSREWAIDPSVSSKWFTSDFALTKADGTSTVGVEKGINVLRETYGALTGHLHEPYYVVVNETNNGWEMLGQATLYANLPGTPVSGEVKIKDGEGKEWDMSVPSAFHFCYVRDESAKNGGGILISKEEMISDSGVAMAILLKRGVLVAKDLGL